MDETENRNHNEHDSSNWNNTPNKNYNMNNDKSYGSSQISKHDDTGRCSNTRDYVHKGLDSIPDLRSGV